MQLLVYITRDNPDCAATMRELTIGHVWFRPIDITNDEHSATILRARLGHDGTLPLVVIREGMRIFDHWNGHQPERLRQFIRDYWGHGCDQEDPGRDPPVPCLGL